MKTLLMALAGLALYACLLIGAAPTAELLVLPPHPLDPAFEKTTEAQIEKAIVESALFRKALKAAAAAKAEREASMKKTPIGPTPAQAARVAFLRTLEEGK